MVPGLFASIGFSYCCVTFVLLLSIHRACFVYQHCNLFLIFLSRAAPNATTRPAEISER